MTITRFGHHDRNEATQGVGVSSTALTGTLLTALVIALEWERSAMEAPMASPVSSAELLLGKVVPYFLLGLASMTFVRADSGLPVRRTLRGSLVALHG